MDRDIESWRALVAALRPDEPLRGELAELLEQHVKLSRRLDRIVKISDAFQSQLRETHLALRRTQEQLAEELRDAALYVRQRLPRPLDAPVRVRWTYEPCTQLGGDALGYRVLPGGERVAFFVLDVCGHGLRSALLSISLLSALDPGGMLDAVAHNPAAVLSALNKAFPAEAHGGLFTTMWYGVYDSFARKLTYASAGHPPALLVGGAESLTVLELGTVGTFLGLVPDATFNNAIMRVDEPARLYVYSDGACEMNDATGRLLDFEGFSSMVRAASLDPDPLSALARSQAALRGGLPQDDDCAVLELVLGVPAKK